jgi:hypothetical protein
VPSDVGQTFTAAELQGDFSQSTKKADVAAFLAANPFFQPNAALAAQGIIDPSKIDPVAQKYIQAGWIPTSPQPSGAISFQNPAQDNRNDFTGKFDWELTDKDHMSVTLGRLKTRPLTLEVSLGFLLKVYSLAAPAHCANSPISLTRVVSRPPC